MTTPSQCCSQCTHAMAVAAITRLLHGDKPGVIAVIGPTGCGKHHAIAEAARQANVAVAYHDLAQGAVEWRRLGKHQLMERGLMPSAHVISNASQTFLKDFSFAKTTQAKIILVADDASPGMCAGVTVVRMQALSSDSVAKRLFLEEDWPAEQAVRAAKAAQGDWHQLHSQKQLCSSAVDDAVDAALELCSRKDGTLANEPPCLIANRLLNGTAPEACPLDAATKAWTERNLALHCDDLEVLARKQELLAASAEGLLAGSPGSQEMFALAAGYCSKHVHYQPRLYSSPWEKDDEQVRTIAESFKRRCSMLASNLKERALLSEKWRG